MDREKLFVVIQAGMTIQTLNELLAPERLALSNVGSISDTSIAGVISTGTHGSGIDYGCLATLVLAIDIMLADGTRVRCSRSENPELFLASLCGLGATGLILRVTLQVEKAFKLKETRKVMHIDDVVRDIEQLAVAGEYVRLWWSPQTDQVSFMSADRTTEVRTGLKIVCLRFTKGPGRLPLLSRHISHRRGFGKYLSQGCWANLSFSSECGSLSLPGTATSLNPVSVSSQAHLSVAQIRFSTWTADTHNTRRNGIYPSPKPILPSLN